MEIESKYDITKSIRNILKLEIKTKPIKDIIVSNIKNLFEQEQNYVEPIRVGDFYNFYNL